MLDNSRTATIHEVISASLLVQARRAAGLSQRELAERVGIAQQEIARYERGRVTPSLERLRALIAACGLELTFALARADDSYDEPIEAALALTPAMRLVRAVRDAQPVRLARARAAGEPAAAPPDLLGALRALTVGGVRYVLVGELAEVLHGSPLLPVTGAVTIAARAGQRSALQAVIAASGGRSLEPPPVSIDASARFALDAYQTELEIAPAPAGTHGYEDLRRDASPIRLGRELTVPVASLVDLVRIAEASGDRARVPALRRTLELQTAPPAAHAA